MILCYYFWTPVWPDDIISESEEQSSANHSPASFLKSNTSTFVNPSPSLSTIDHAYRRDTIHAPSTVEKAKSEPDMSDNELKSDVSIIIESGTSTHNFGSRGATELLLTNDERVTLTDQNSVTLHVVQALAGLVEARAPFSPVDLKDEACNEFTVYICLGCNCTASALLVNHRQHDFMKFDDNDVPKPAKNKPYLVDMMVHLMKGRYFNGPKFSDIAKNKAKRPEVTIQMVALTAT
ncbi:hypothetical protein C8R48DRAFT_678550 [Suillus tomentosus]|nr:hypothetical protein C8R48DRAFT_678550 [Suillus tomentosus]